MPPVYGPADTLVRRGYAPDTLAAAARPRLGATFAARPPELDGDLADWQLVRWTASGAPAALVRGAWRGAGDLGLRFALQWTTAGLFLGASLHDDSLAAPEAPVREQESLVLALASGSPVVQRYWLGGSRRIRVRAGGAVEAWTDLRNRRPEFFDAGAAGVRAATRRAGQDVAFEVFVPWNTLYPALPGDAAQLLGNVLVEDMDGGEAKHAAAFVERAGGRSRPVWARLECAGQQPRDAWIVSQGSAHAEGLLEWCLWRREDGPEALSVRLEGTSSRVLGATLPAGPAFVRLRDPGLGRGVWEDVRRGRVVLRAGGRHHAAPVWSVPDTLAIDAVLGSLAARLDAGADGGFPGPADAIVRLARARSRVRELGTWSTRRYGARGILAYRGAAWSRLEESLAEAEIAALPPSPQRQARLAERWPRRTSGGTPQGEVVVRGYRSALDGSVQPYALFVPESPGAEPRPLVVALHGLDEDERSPFTTTRLAAACAARGWIALAPFGRGPSGYELAGEIDVLDAIAATRAALPVDGRRLYVLGSGMGGTGAWLLSLRHPQLFAAAAVVSAYGDFDQSELFQALGYQEAERIYFDARNPVRLMHAGVTTAYRIAHAERDPVISVVHARILHDRMQQLGIEHEYALDASGDHGPRFLDRQLEACLEHMGRHQRSEPGAAAAEPFPGTAGPVAEFFARGPFAIVHGTAARAPGRAAEDATAAEQLAHEWQVVFTGSARVLPDTEVTPELLRSTNLVLVGVPESNALLRRWAAGLPVEYGPDGFVVGGGLYLHSKYGILYAASNPEFAARSLLVLSGMKDRFQGGKTLLRLGVDYAIVGPHGQRTLGHFARP